MKGVLGIPLIRGNSDAIEPVLYTGAVVAGAAVSIDSTDPQLTVKAFDSAAFSGFLLASDINTKAKTASVVITGQRVPIKAATGKSFTAGGGVFLNASGEAVPEGDGSEVYQVNGQIRDSSFTGISTDSSEVEAITVDLYGGGAPVTPAP